MVEVKNVLPAVCDELVFASKLRKQNHIPNTRAIGKKHDQPVYANTLACGGRQAVLKGPDIVGVVVHGLLIPDSLALACS